MPLVLCSAFLPWRRANAGDELGWAERISSPHPGHASSSVIGALEGECGEPDDALRAAAEILARGSESAGDPDVVMRALRRAGDASASARAMALEGAEVLPAVAALRMRRWRSGLRTLGAPRCGIYLGLVPNRGEVFVALMADTLAQLAALPALPKTGSFLQVTAEAKVASDDARVFVLPPSGVPRAIPSTFREGTIRAGFWADQPGIWDVQIVLGLPSGPQAAIEAPLFVGCEPEPLRIHASAPGEDLDPRVPRTAETLARMVNRAREEMRQSPLVLDGELSRRAARHSERMLRQRTLAHDVGNGSPQTRYAQASLREVGENIAHAKSLALAHRALWNSPSHRTTLLNPRFERIGAGVAVDADGTVWVTEAFGR